MLRVYTASKLKHAAKWRDLCAAHGHIQCHARWLKHNTIGTPDTPEHAAEFWLQDEQDVKHADVVLVFADGDDHLRGALVEAGMAIAYGVPVIVIGKHPDYGTWQHHPGVRRVASLDLAIDVLRVLRPRYHEPRRFKSMYETIEAQERGNFYD